MPVQPDLFTSTRPGIELSTVQHGTALQLLQALLREALSATFAANGSGKTQGAGDEQDHA
jgi:hypothetical protein